jgi:hypothetical protein
MIFLSHNWLDKCAKRSAVVAPSLDQYPEQALARRMRRSFEEIATIPGVPLGIVKRWVPAMLLIALTCACRNTPVQIESRALADPSAQSSERFIIAAVDNDPVEFVAHAGSTPRGYGLSAAYGSTSRARDVMHALEHDYGLREVSAWPIVRLHMHCAVLQIREGTDRESLLAKMSRDPRIKLAQPLQTFATRSPGSEVSTGISNRSALRPEASSRVHR